MPGIQISGWDVLGVFQPDGFAFVTIDGQRFLITADEGDQKDYEIELGWLEEERGRTVLNGEMKHCVLDNEFLVFAKFLIPELLCLLVLNRWGGFRLSFF